MLHLAILLLLCVPVQLQFREAAHVVGPHVSERKLMLFERNGTSSWIYSEETRWYLDGREVRLKNIPQSPYFAEILWVHDENVEGSYRILAVWATTPTKGAGEK